MPAFGNDPAHTVPSCLVDIPGVRTVLDVAALAALVIVLTVLASTTTAAVGAAVAVAVMTTAAVRYALLLPRIDS
ncbi:hypothetical protein H0B43_12995 [Rhodococcus wratislaviensis]|nr:hypothetical protein [Rhodococcus sp. 4CII]